MARDGQITVDDLDDEPDGVDPNEPDDDDDGLDDEPDDGGDPADQQPQRQGRQRRSYQELMEENEQLRLASDPEWRKRTNRQLANQRQVAKWMEQHDIADLTSWLDELGIDPSTGKLRQASKPPSDAPPAATETLPAPPAGVDNPPAPKPDGDDFETRLQAELAKRREADEQEQAVLRTTVRKQALRAELRARNFSGTPATAYKLVNLEDISIDEDGEVTGLDAVIDQLRSEVPELFPRARPETPPPPSRRVDGSSVDGGGRPQPPPRKTTWEERTAAQMGFSGR
jgi:hypothetical protein